MKNLTIKILTICVLLFGAFNSINAQVTLEHVYDFHNKQFWVTDIGNNDYKYVIVDTTGFSLYNLDHSPFLVNFVPPIPVYQAPNYYQISYITKSLFDCDSTNIEYVISATNHIGNFYIYRTDGTLIFERDTVKGPYCFGCGAGSIWSQPIFNTPNGAKLTLFNYNLITGEDSSLYVYSLCGTLPASMSEISIGNNYVEVFPNPTNGIINFQISQPNNQEKFKLTIYNSSFQKIDESNINEKKYQLDLKQKSLSAGTYLFDLRTDNKVYQTGKFIITK